MWYYLWNPIISNIKPKYNFVTSETIINQTIYAFCFVLKFLHKGAVVQSSTEDIITMLPYCCSVTFSPDFNHMTLSRIIESCCGKLFSTSLVLYGPF